MSDTLVDCGKCSGAGWCWGRELDNADANTYDDTMTKYTCDRCKGTRVELGDDD